MPHPIKVGEAEVFPIPEDPATEFFVTEEQQGWLERWLDRDQGAASLIRVPYDASLGDNAKFAARALAEAALDRLRLAFDSEDWIYPEHLRFEIGGVRWVPNVEVGWAMRRPAVFPLEPINEDPMLESVESSRFLALPLEPTNDIQRRASIAAQWMSRAYFEGDQTVQLLFRFSALEAILGNKAEGLKGYELAIRRATLAWEVDGMYRHPSAVFDLYDKVRSAAVHGEAVPELDKDDASKFTWDSREAIDQFLNYADQYGFTKRSQVRAKLDTCENRAKLIARLVQEDAKKWSPFAPSPMTYDEVLTKLLGMMGREVVVSYSAGNARVFSFFGSTLVSGLDAPDAEALQRDVESLELQFGNGVSVTLDPSQFKHAEMTSNDNGAILKVTFGDATISLTDADLS